MNDHDGNVALERAKEAVTRVTLDQRADPAKSMKKPAPARTIKMVKRAFKGAGKAVAEVLKQVPPLAPIQSKAGCPWCCYIRLTASVPEVLAVLDYIQEPSPPRRSPNSSARTPTSTAIPGGSTARPARASGCRARC